MGRRLEARAGHLRRDPGPSGGTRATALAWGARTRQRGLSLLFALIALAAISLAAVALVRAVDTGSLVIGNLGFKQDATSAAAQGAEVAVAWLQARAGTAALHADAPAAGYYASSLDALDATGQGSTLASRALVDWTNDVCASSGVPDGGCMAASAELSLNGGANRVRYVITRLCATEGDPSVVDCAFPLKSATSAGGNRGVVDYKAGKATVAVSNQQYYRIVVRALSARGTVAFTETLLQL